MSPNITSENTNGIFGHPLWTPSKGYLLALIHYYYNFKKHGLLLILMYRLWMYRNYFLQCKKSPPWTEQLYAPSPSGFRDPSLAPPSNCLTTNGKETDSCFVDVMHDVIHTRAKSLSYPSKWDRSPEDAKFWIFQIRWLLAEIRPILWSEVN